MSLNEGSALQFGEELHSISVQITVMYDIFMYL